MRGLHFWFRQHAQLTTALTPRQSVFINTTSLMTSPYLLLVTGSLRSNLSRAKCTAQVGMSYRLMRVMFVFTQPWMDPTRQMMSFKHSVWFTILPLIARFMGSTWGPSGADRTQVGPMLAPWTPWCITLQQMPNKVQWLQWGQMGIKAYHWQHDS